MAVVMLLAACYGVAQLAFLGWPARSVRFGTLLLAVPVGLYGCGSVALALQLIYTRARAAGGTPLYLAVAQASYTVDPVIEEVVKVLPLIVVLAGLRRMRRQWGLTDFLLAGAATGAGFSLVEALLRWGQSGSTANAAPGGGWDVSANLSGVEHVGGVGELLGGWLPAPVYNTDLFSFGVGSSIVDRLDQHLVWTALSGFGIGVLVRISGWRRLLGLLPLAYACADHATYNYSLVQTSGHALVSRVFADVRPLLWLCPLLALALAMTLDILVLRRGLAAHPELRTDLAGFAAVSPLFTAPIAMRFAMARRALLYALDRAPESTVDTLTAAVRETQQRIEAARDKQRWQAVWRRLALRLPSVASGAGNWVGRILRSWQVWVWLVLLLPTVLYLVLGSYPPLSFLQRALSSRAVFPVMAGLAVVGLVWLAYQLVRTARGVPAILRGEHAEPFARTGFRLLSGAGALVAGLASVLTWLSGVHANGRVINNVHILDALSQALLVLALALFLASFFMFPPLGLAVATTGEIALVLTPAAGAFATSVGAAGVLGAFGAMLAMASSGSDGGGDGGDSGGGDQSTPDDQARQQRLNDLAKDPSHNGQVTPNSMQEARIGLDLEGSGKLDGPITRDPTGAAEFIDANGKSWDIKGFNSNFPPRSGGYDLASSMTKIGNEIRLGENVIVDTSKMSPAAVQELRTAVQGVADWAGKVVWWP